MTEIASAQDLEKLIGYTFHNPTILEDALTRRAFINENSSLNINPIRNHNHEV